MKKVMVALIVVLELLYILSGCSGSLAESSSSATAESVYVHMSESVPSETNRSAAVCMGSVSHPVCRIVQLGFMEKADELGYEGHILGLSEGSTQELYACWLEGAKEYDIAGAVCWVVDDSAYEFLKELHGMGVKTVAATMPHDYIKTRDFIDVNLRHSRVDDSIMVADFIGQSLFDRGLFSGSIAVTMNGYSSNYYLEGSNAFWTYMPTRYPDYTYLDAMYEGAVPEEAVAKVQQLILEHPEIIAAFGMSNNSALVWANGKKAAGRPDILVAAYSDSRDGLDLLAAGDVDVLVGQPLYEAGYVGLELIDRLLNGKVYNTSEALWIQKLETHLIYQGGKGKHDPAYYYAIHARAEERFGVQ